MALSRDFTVSRSRRGAVGIVHAAGDLDIYVAERFTDALSACIAATDGPVVADLSRVTHLDSAGLNCLIVSSRLLRDLGRDFAIVAATPAVLLVLERTGLDQALPPHPTVDAAVARWA